LAVQNPPVFLQAGSHPAEDVRRYTDAQMDGRGGIVSPGDLAVTENGSPNMTVNVAAGRHLGWVSLADLSGVLPDVG
jgi:hypothetical protein